MAVVCQSVLLHTALTQLLTSAEAAPPAQHDDRRDLPQVHAVNVLKAVFREATLSTALTPYTERACLVAMEAFACDVWVLRNAATQLFS